MKSSLTLSLSSLFLLAGVLGQSDSDPIQYTPTHNITTIYGTWSSGSMNVVTGSGFASPSNVSFHYPPTTGVSYSLQSLADPNVSLGCSTEDGYYELAQYRMSGNASNPNCISGVMMWAHGTYTLQPNGSITGIPFGDGYMQVEEACGALSNFIQDYNDTELYTSWGISQGTLPNSNTNTYILQMYQYNGEPLPEQYQVSTTPIMLPTKPLRNIPSGSAASDIVLSKRNGGDRRSAGVGVLVAGVAAITTTSLLL
ncbi:hypothetical protein CONPUDRAFT_50054 [Coniophora puteana RWD-64-598 SS2]|uniref:Uncharacterized protein n=1 Tax=Coniophora puteana (strain RWD-64-598) TaxID=741705 RepID=A0A5M3MZD0_CONPW|nr:uncharacterized protein CONPUDRAFT_50054 [Coniophora puteana RWD-64-598 SS2]EIW84489.1 hypothetical protein CONPUDRAFT_50054 [Coniophora puteana RWD-64-598 SS2]